MKGRMVAASLWAGLVVLLLAGCPARSGSEATQTKESRMASAAFTKTEYPRIAMLWSGTRGADRHELASWAKHDFVMVSPGQIGMV